jgi:hypothetical protein
MLVRISRFVGSSVAGVARHNEQAGFAGGMMSVGFREFNSDHRAGNRSASARRHPFSGSKPACSSQTGVSSMPNP